MITSRFVPTVTLHHCKLHQTRKGRGCNTSSAHLRKSRPLQQVDPFPTADSIGELAAHTRSTEDYSHKPLYLSWKEHAVQYAFSLHLGSLGPTGHTISSSVRTTSKLAARCNGTKVACTGHSTPSRRCPPPDGLPMESHGRKAEALSGLQRKPGSLRRLSPTSLPSMAQPERSAPAGAAQ